MFSKLDEWFNENAMELSKKMLKVTVIILLFFKECFTFVITGYKESFKK